MILTPTSSTNHSSLNELGWTASAHTIADDEPVYFGDPGNGNYFIYNSADDRIEFYRNNVLKRGI